MMTIRDMDLEDDVVCKYIKALVGQFYKILPIKESGEPSLSKYMESLQRELIGCKDLILRINDDELYLSLLSILEYLIDNDVSVDVVRSEVFKAINICKKLQKRYFSEEV